MKIIKTINLENTTPQEEKTFRVRNSARAIVLDDNNKIAIMNVSNHGFYKIPGGGIKEAETWEDGLRREIKEEAGVEIEIVKEIGLIKEIKKMHNLVQNSFCYLAKVVGDKGEPQLTDKEKGEGYLVEWLDPEEVLDKLKKSKFDFPHKEYVFMREIFLLEKGLEILKKSLE